jgi:hypothetical protein
MSFNICIKCGEDSENIYNIREDPRLKNIISTDDGLKLFPENYVRNFFIFFV